jgi:hypothetical protein
VLGLSGQSVYTRSGRLLFCLREALLPLLESMCRAPLGQKTRCPYTLSPLSELAATNVEHIFPHAIGGPASYAVRADAAENSWFGTKVDAPFVDADFVRLARTLLQIRGRSGVPEMRLQGATEPGQPSIKVTILPNGTHRYRYEKPWVFDENTGHGSTIIRPEDAEREMRRLAQLYAKKKQSNSTSLSRYS